MAIFRKCIKEISTAVFAIEADTKEEADKIFDEFLDNGMLDNNEYCGVTFEDYRNHMNDERHVEIEDLVGFPNEDAYNRSSSLFAYHDFYLNKKKHEEVSEPLYDLYFKDYNSDIFSATSYTSYKDITISKVIDLINVKNMFFTLIPSIPPSAKDMIDARKKGKTVICFVTKGRTK